MCPDERGNETADQPVFTVERKEKITLVRFLDRDELPGTDLRVIDSLWELFDAERRDPSHILAMLFPGSLLNRKSLENLLGLRPSDAAMSPHEVRERVIRQENVIQRFVANVRQLQSFVVCCVTGEVAFRLMGPLLACDYRIATEETVFVNTTQDLPYAPLGVLPWLLTRTIGTGKTTDLLLETPRLSSGDARDLGIVNHVTTADLAETEVLEVVHRLASLPGATLIALKRAMVASCEDFRTYMEQERTWTQHVGAKKG